MFVGPVARCGAAGLAASLTRRRQAQRLAKGGIECALANCNLPSSSLEINAPAQVIFFMLLVKLSDVRLNRSNIDFSSKSKASAAV